MSKITTTALVACLIALPMLASPALAAKNIGTRPITITRAIDSNCETIMVPQWSCPPGKEPGDIFGGCTIIMVEQKVCHAA
jgi:hypothetical protein